MKAYVISIITLSVISGIISALLPSNEGGLKKQINFISGLICAIILLSPVVSVAKNAASLTDGIENVINSLNVSEKIEQSNSIIIESGKEQIASGVKSAITSKFKFEDENVFVTITVNDENVDAITLEQITVTLQNEATWTDSQEILEYVEGLVGCSVKIVKK